MIKNLTKEEEAELVRVPTEKAPEPWPTVLKRIQNPLSITDLLLDEGTPQQYQAILSQISYGWALHWVYKNQWDSRHKIPQWQRLKPETRKAIKLLGEMFCKLADLCIQTREIQALAGSTPYNTGTQWFGLVALELRNEEFEQIRHNDLSGKDDYVRLLRSRIGKMRKFDVENPFDLITQPHSYALVDAATPILGRSEPFRKGYWRPFLDAYRDHVVFSGSSSAWAWTFEQGNSIRTYGKGGAKPLLKSLNSSKH